MKKQFKTKFGQLILLLTASLLPFHSYAQTASQATLQHRPQPASHTQEVADLAARHLAGLQLRNLLRMTEQALQADAKAEDRGALIAKVQETYAGMPADQKLAIIKRLVLACEDAERLNASPDRNRPSATQQTITYLLIILGLVLTATFHTGFVIIPLVVLYAMYIRNEDDRAVLENSALNIRKTKEALLELQYSIEIDLAVGALR